MFAILVRYYAYAFVSGNEFEIEIFHEPIVKIGFGSEAPIRREGRTGTVEIGNAVELSSFYQDSYVVTYRQRSHGNLAIEERRVLFKNVTRILLSHGFLLNVIDHHEGPTFGKVNVRTM